MGEGRDSVSRGLYRGLTSLASAGPFQGRPRVDGRTQVRPLSFPADPYGVQTIAVRNGKAAFTVAWLPAARTLASTALFEPRTTTP